ncbi:hypothetical protein R3W88_033778 [Solanum pinnatisectum]|uniref:Nodulin-like domain-containing protein n=1 Tax=Solanum pinnatisectum TaxID=50273 RepID=A0AAV9K146_9SOLN|nr:hypothetical protein R3W88_033778 [Solanum pinnatisectum]
MVETQGAGSTTKGDGGVQFVLHVLRGRWFSLFASFLIMSGAGATYLFGVYSQEIKNTLGYDQITIVLLGFFKDLGVNVGVLSVGAAMNFTGYFMIWLSVIGKISKPKVWQMCIYICLGANSQNFANTGALVTSVRNLPESRGNMIGLLKGFTGLSGAIMTQLYLAVYGNDAQSLILLIAWMPAALSLIFVYTIRQMKVVRQPNQQTVFFHCLLISIVLALFLMVTTLLEKAISFSHAAYVVAATVSCALLFSPLLVFIREELAIWRQMKQNNGGVANTIVENPPPTEIPQPQKDQVNSKTSTSSCFSKIFFEKPASGEDYSILQALLSTDMLILFVATLCGLGSSLTAVDNMARIGGSLGYPKTTVKSFLSLLSIWNFFGRIFSGFVSESLLVRYKFPRTLMMTLILLLSCIGLLLIAFPFPGSLHVASIIIGFSFGAQMPLLFTIISELFGLKYYSTLFNCGQLASPLGSYILNVKVTGPLYDRKALKDLKKKGLTRAFLPFIVLACVTFFGAMASLILVARTRQFYKGDIYKKFKQQPNTPDTKMASSNTTNNTS